jgi:AcrR family transcriptional regulator
MENENFEIKEDLRTVRTRKMLSNALFEMLMTTPFEKINVNDICDKAMVHRTTFYKHFESKFHLLTFAISELRDNIVNKCLKENYDCEKAFYLALASNVLDFVDDKRDFLINIVDNIKSSDIILQIMETMQQNIKFILNENNSNCNYKLPKDAISAYLTGAFASLGEWYLFHNGKTSKAQILEFLDGVLDEKLFLKQN